MVFLEGFCLLMFCLGIFLNLKDSGFYVFMGFLCVCKCMSVSVCLFCECMYLNVCTYFMCFCLALFSCLCLLPHLVCFLFYFIATIILVPICFLMREKGKAWIWVGEEVARIGEELGGGETVIGIYCVKKKINEKRNNTIAYCPHCDLQVCGLTASACSQLCSLWRCVIPEHFLHPLREALSSEQSLSSR